MLLKVITFMFFRFLFKFWFTFCHQPDVDGILGGVMEVYTQGNINKVELYGPTNFTPVNLTT